MTTMKRYDFILIVDKDESRHLLRKEDIQAIWECKEPDENGDTIFIQMEGDDREFGFNISYDEIIEQIFGALK